MGDSLVIMGVLYMTAKTKAKARIGRLLNRVVDKWCSACGWEEAMREAADEQARFMAVVDEELQKMYLNGVAASHRTEGLS